MDKPSGNWAELSAYTESLLPFPKPQSVEEANANNQCPALAQFWAENSKLKEAIIFLAWCKTQTPEMRQWQADFDARYPNTSSGVNRG